MRILGYRFNSSGAKRSTRKRIMRISGSQNPPEVKGRYATSPSAVRRHNVHSPLLAPPISLLYSLCFCYSARSLKSGRQIPPSLPLPSCGGHTYPTAITTRSAVACNLSAINCGVCCFFGNAVEVRVKGIGYIFA